MSGIVSKNAGRASGIVGAGDVGADAVDGSNIADDAIDSEHYADVSIDAAHIASNAVTTAKINADAVTGAKIADDAIDSEHYTDGSIDNAHIADDAIDSEHYAAGSIDEAHIADNAVTLAKMAGGTDGTIITFDASGNPSAVGPGTDGQVLTSTGAGSPPAFEDAAAGGVDGITSSADATAISISSDEEVTMPLQPYMLSWGGAQANVTGAGTTVNVSVTEVIDTGSNTASNTFTAPITGKYLICTSVHVEGVTSNATAVGHNIITSNRTYGSFIYDSGADLEEYHNIKNAVVADMDAADTCLLQCRIADMSGDTADLGSGNGYHYWTVTLLT